MKTKTKPKTRRVRIKPVLAWAYVPTGRIGPRDIYPNHEECVQQISRIHEIPYRLTHQYLIRVRIVPLSTPKGRQR